MRTQHKPNLKSSLWWHFNKGELHPTGTLSDIFTATAYVNPRSEAVSVIAVKTIFCRDFIQCGDEKHTLY